MYPRIATLLLFPLLLLSVLGVTAGQAGAAGTRQVYVDGAATPIQAVDRLVKPFTRNANNNAPCNALTGKLSACPITPRLRRQLARELAWEKQHPNGGYGNDFCRCQNPAQKVTMKLLNSTGKVAHVRTHWVYGASNSFNLIYVVVHSPSGWRVDDTFCAGRPATTMYKLPVGPCS